MISNRLYIFAFVMDKEILLELRKAYIEDWITKEDVLDAFQRKLISYEDYLWIIGAELQGREVCRIKVIE